MKRGKYLSIKLQDCYAIDKRTNTRIYDELVLYNYTADENNIYYDYPHLDYPDNYIIIDADKEIELKQFLLDRNIGKKHYAVISKNTRLAGFENYNFEPCSAFYCVEVADFIYDRLKDIDLNTLSLDLSWFGTSLYSFTNTADVPVTGMELVFFLDSADPSVNSILNNLREIIIKARLQAITQELLAVGIKKPFKDGIENIRFTASDSEYLGTAVKYQEERLYNAGRVLALSTEEINDISNTMSDNLNKLNNYITEYTTGLAKLLASNPNLSEIKQHGDILSYGYIFKE